jgi:hypothetical protein
VGFRNEEKITAAASAAKQLRLLISSNDKLVWL